MCGLSDFLIVTARYRQVDRESKCTMRHREGLHGQNVASRNRDKQISPFTTVSALLQINGYNQPL